MACRTLGGVELSGIVAGDASADDDLRRERRSASTTTTATGPKIAVPGHWRNQPDVRRQRRPAALPPPLRARTPAAGQRRWVTLDGVFYQADVWLDGAYLGDPEGYFFPHSFDITGAVAARRRARAGGRGGVRAAAQRTAASATSPACSSTGTRIDRDVEPRRAVAPGAHRRRPGRCGSTGLRCCAATPTTRAPTCACTPGSTATTARRARVRTLGRRRRVAEPEQSLAGGLNEVDWNLDIDEPRAVVAVVARRAAADRR